MTTYVIPECNLDELRGRVDRLNVTCGKLGLTPISLVEVGRETRKIAGDIGFDRFVEYVAVEVTGESPIIGGWSFVAQIEHGEAGNIIRNITGQPLPDVYRNAGPDCDHCGQKRNRNNTYVLINTDGEYTQVGSSCLIDFTGHADIHAIAAYLESLNEIASGLDDFDADRDIKGSGRHVLIGTAQFLSVVAGVIRLHGWLGKTKAQAEQRVSTCERAIDIMYPPPYAKRDELTTTPEDIALAEASIAWAVSNVCASEYEHNLSVVCAGDYCSWRNLGLLASVIVAYRKAQGQYEQGKRGTSEWVGTPGDKVTLPVKVVRINESSGQYGLTSIVTMTSGDNSLVWFCSGKTALEVGQECNLKGTVKSHGQYNGVKQTTLTRCKVVA